MKKLLLNLTIVLCTAITTLAQNVNIPDANFKAYLVGRTDSINTNKDTEISVQEAEAFKGKLSLSSINNLAGLDAFKNITRISVGGTESVDLRNNTELVKIEAGFGLKHLNISKCIKLKSLQLYIGTWEIGYLDVSNNINLDTISTFATGISSLDLRNCKNLKFVHTQGGSVCINPSQINSISWKSELGTFLNTNCKKNKGDFPTNPKTLNPSIADLDTISNFSRGKQLRNNCTNTYDYNLYVNLIDIFYTFKATENNHKFNLTLGNPNWKAKVVLLDTTNFTIAPNYACDSVHGGGQFSFSNLTIGQQYMFRLEIGGTSPLGHARTDVSANTFSVLLNPTVTSIDSEALLNQNKTLQSIYNLQGIEVDKNYSGLVIYRYTDGTTQKVLQ